MSKQFSQVQESDSPPEVVWTEQIGGAFKLHYKLPQWTVVKSRLSIRERRERELDKCRKLLAKTSYDSEIAEQLHERISFLEKKLH
jgi:hypothetical protein